MILTRERLMQLVIYDPASGVFTNKVKRRGLKVGKVLGSVEKWGYVVIGIDKKKYKAHRLAWLYVHGYFPKMIDHINLVKSDNRLINLRECNDSENMLNTGLRSNGVSFHEQSGRWRAELRVTVDGTQTRYHRWCDSFEEACKARRQFELELASPFLRTSL